MSHNLPALLQVTNLVKDFPIREGVFRRATGRLRAVDRVTLSIAEGETLGLVGESGCGKTTVGRTILRLVEPTAGMVVFSGDDLLSLSPREMDERRTDMQVVMQDPISSLDPRMSIKDIVAEPFVAHGRLKGQALKDRVAALLEMVGMTSDHLWRYPHELSGGQRQRINIARAIALSPRFLVLDEPTSALDVSVQAQILNLLADLQRDMKITYLFISHDLSVIKHVSHRIAIMYLGRVVEIGPVDEVYDNPANPYTQALLAAIPAIDLDRKGERFVISGETPSALAPPPGCHFHTRCPFVQETCRRVEPVRATIGKEHSVWCHLLS
jgi:oligopeptide/dipeptide ABC transporter ATP-binding protein